MNVRKEDQLLKAAKNNLKTAKQLLPGIIRDAKLDEQQQEILWERIFARQKDINNRERILEAEKKRLGNLNNENSFCIDYPVKVVRHSDSKWKFFIEDGKTKPVFFEGKSFRYIWYLAQKAISDDIDGKIPKDKGWLTDEDIVKIDPKWDSVKSVTGARKRIRDFLAYEDNSYKKLIERAKAKKQDKNKGFRISSPCVITEDKSSK